MSIWKLSQVSAISDRGWNVHLFGGVEVGVAEYAMRPHLCIYIPVDHKMPPRISSAHKIPLTEDVIDFAYRAIAYTSLTTSGKICKMFPEALSTLVTAED